MTPKKQSRASRTESKRRSRRWRRAFAVLASFAGLLLITAGWFSQRGDQTAQTAIEYGPEDITYDQPLHAIHEMEVGPSIPFLTSDGPQPSIVVDKSFHQFGSLGSEDVVTTEFVIANVGEAPLTISRAYTTCGCTTADLTSAIIPPGEVSIMTVTFDAGFHDTRGQTVQRGVVLENNDPERSNVELWTQASVRMTP